MRKLNCAKFLLTVSLLTLLVFVQPGATFALICPSNAACAPLPTSVTPFMAVSCDPLPVGATATVENNVCVYHYATASSTISVGTPAVVTSCDPLPLGATATIVNNVCVYSYQNTAPTGTMSAPMVVVSCDPLPPGVTATVENNVCVYHYGNTTAQSPSAPTYTTNTTALQAQIDTLMATVHSLEAQVQAQQQKTSEASVMMTSSAFGQQVKTIANNLGKGSSGEDVTTLQQFLISENKGPSANALANVGATGRFGNITRKALAEFQASVGISATGNFGPITKAYIGTHY